jgi:Inner membrane protein YgaP-like, transmembrane domain
MKKNVNSIDKVIRVLLAVVLGILIFSNQVTGILAIIFGVLAVVLLLTSFLSFCPIYAMLNLSTLKKSEKS